MTGSSTEDDALVLRVWYEPAFRARVTATDPSGSGRSVVLTSPEAVLSYVGQWVAATQPASTDPSDVGPGPDPH